MGDVKIYINNDPHVNDKTAENMQSQNTGSSSGSSGSSSAKSSSTSSTSSKKSGKKTLAEQASKQAKKKISEAAGKAVDSGGVKGKLKKMAVQKGTDAALTGIFAVIPGGPVIKKLLIVPGYPEFPFVVIFAILSLLACVFKYWWLSLLIILLAIVGRAMAKKGGKAFKIVRIIVIALCVLQIGLGIWMYMSGGPFKKK